MLYTKQEWYTPAEVAVHNTATDCWVSLNGKVYDMTSWLQEQFRVCKCTKSCSCEIKNWFCRDDCVEKCPCFKRGFLYCDGKRLAMSILAFAGKDVSHWFDGDDWIVYTHPITGSRTPYLRFGSGPNQPVVPSTKWRPLDKVWWLNEDLVVGKVTAKTRPIRITNTITGSTETLEVCSEETIYQIIMRYIPYNSHCMSYAWRYRGKPICLQRTLEQNGMPDERDRFSKFALPENMHIPAILLYYNDDLTEEWYTPAEVAVHNTATDCWVSLNGKVYDMTSWLQEQFRVCKCTKSCSCEIKNWFCGDDCVEKCPCFKRGFLYCDGKRLAMSILAFAGKDVSHWFDGDDWIVYTHPITGSRTPYLRFGSGPNQPVVPSTKWRPLDKVWWLNEDLVVGKVTAKTRPIRITNTITGSTVTLEVCSEETIYQIIMRYIPYNSHCMSYAWRYRGKPLCLQRTLEQNGIRDERDRFSKFALPENMHIPAILLYYNDDLTEDLPRDDCYCHALDCVLGRPEKCYVNVTFD